MSLLDKNLPHSPNLVGFLDGYPRVYLFEFFQVEYEHLPPLERAPTGEGWQRINLHPRNHIKYNCCC